MLVNGYVSLAASLALVANAYQVPATYPKISGCALQTPTYSCENTTVINNTCCSPTPGGLVLVTQFWSRYTGLEKQGQLLPRGSWTIHGLWPDNCDGSYEQYCDLSRQYDPDPSPSTLPNGIIVPAYTGPSVNTFVESFGRDDLLDFMNTYWINQGAPNTDLWAHEFSKHATCTSTFDVSCYGASYQRHEEVVNFFDAVIRSFHQYPTFDILASAGIVPCNRTAYTLDQIRTAIETQTGAIPYLGCSNGTILSEVWYYNHVYGTEQYGTYKTLDSTSDSSCSKTEPIWYYERTLSSEHEVRKTGSWW
ncbi:ribonuclease T2 [Guyanagaster necrorhizus]|uniref:ribonuclease T2 n=1 Tax=Guyanagaster necrorhizus TaxID=856835 RepID=A0A9P7W2W5_9AGAR|nr:ribonuclease T2 [Guyanagaster necrorhizus MCA 3950]KAG7452371.1 ribonuclease T2 [Guyanagaster necrorhizus MCA 3950]